MRKRALPVWLRLRSWLGLDGPESASLERRQAAIRNACLKAARSYRARPYSGPLWILRAGRLTDWVRADGSDRTSGWGPLVRGGVESVELDCEHLDLFRQPALGQLASELIRAFERERG